MRSAFVGLWLCAMSLAGAFLPHPKAENTPAAPPPRAAFAALPLASGELMAVTDVREGRVVGYLLLRFTAVLDDREAPRLAAIEPHLLADATYRYFETHAIGDIAQANGFAVAALKDGMREEINAIAGASLVVAVLIEQVDYLDFDEVRRKSAARTLVLTP